MTTTSIRIDRSAHERLKKVAEKEQSSLSGAINELLDRYEKQTFREQMRKDFTALREDTAAWAEYEAETELWDQAAGDGLENEPPFYDVEDESS